MAKRLSVVTMAGLIFFIFFAVLIFSGCKEDKHNFVFDHQAHAKHDKSCMDCHGDEFDYVSKADHEQCKKCHEIVEDTPSETCLICHNTLEKQKTAKINKTDYSTVEIDHKGHAQKGVVCSQCHGDVEQQVNLSGIGFISMEECVHCHFPNKTEQMNFSCEICHFEMDKSKPTKKHENIQWTSLHGNQFMIYPDKCTRCHQKSYCSACHKTTMPEFHTIAFKKRGHGTYSSNNPEKCEVCHKQEFCISCHVTTEPVYHTAAFKNSRPYIHCGMCHFPIDSGNRCFVCHKSAPHNQARADAPPPPPFVPTGLPCFVCHPVDLVPVTHLYNTIPDTECTFCH